RQQRRYNQFPRGERLNMLFPGTLATLSMLVAPSFASLPQVATWQGAGTTCSATSIAAPPPATAAVEEKMWKWRDYDIRYTQAGQSGASKDGPATILIHGFGGNADHFRGNTGVLGGQAGPTYAIDLLGYGFSSKPDPGSWEEKNSIYNFEQWSDQILDFTREVVGRKEVFLVANSVGGVVALQAAATAASDVHVKGAVLFNMSLRMLHTSKQAPLARPFTTALQYVLRETFVGPAFFGNVAQAKTVKSILQQCYGDPNTVTDELVDLILKPGLTDGAVKVFLDFISYSGGPLPEELLPKVTCPVMLGWGDKDPWEPMEMGRELYGPDAFDCVEGFEVLEGAGHCPQDEQPHRCNSLILDFIARHK
ncbi:unnamed protein product, partial [Chrysoparadoxa australica]